MDAGPSRVAVVHVGSNLGAVMVAGSAAPPSWFCID